MVQSGLLISFFVIYSSKDTAYECYMDPEPGSQSGPGDSVDADLMAPSLLVTKSGPPSVGGLRKHGRVCRHAARYTGGSFFYLTPHCAHTVVEF